MTVVARRSELYTTSSVASSAQPGKERRERVGGQRRAGSRVGERDREVAAAVRKCDEPVRARPKSVAASRPRSRAVSGASVATTICTIRQGSRLGLGASGLGILSLWLAKRVASELLSDRRAVDRQHASVVRLHQHAELCP